MSLRWARPLAAAAALLLAALAVTQLRAERATRAGVAHAGDELRRSDELAAATLRRRPSSWQAAMVLGGARLLRIARANDDAPYRAPERWRAPLRHAARLAPGEPEPLRLLALGYLTSW